jgi:pyruvate/2-oxoglutarate dehydrogenase complex dihydrolipoamide dehydrogenase (E3) component
MGDFDVVVLGGGAAGVHVATEVVRGGRSAALIEVGLIGGESGYLACLPSNSLLASAARGEAWEDAVARRDEVTGGLDDSGAAARLAAAGVTVIRGTGRVTGPGTVSVSGQSLGYSDLVIATGSEPVAPPIEGLSDIPAWTTAEALCSPDLPRRLIVLGGGPAGCELAQIYAAFGSQVTLVEAEPGLLPGEVAFAGEILAAALRLAGAELCLGSHATKAERTSDGLTLALDDGTRIDADRLLLATGRRPRVGGLGLEALGITVAPGQPVPTTTSCRVAGPGINGPGFSGAGFSGAGFNGAAGFGRVWAAGDVTGLSQTHAGRYQAGVVAANILGQEREADYSAIPRCVYTVPSVYAVGIGYAVGEPARPGLRAARVTLGEVTRGRLGPANLGHADLGCADLGCVELYAEDGVLVGGVAVGPDAASWMAEVTLAIRAKVPVTVLADVVHAFPTYGEALQTAFRELARTGGGPGRAGHNEKGIGPVSELHMETPEDDAIEQHQEVIADEGVAGVRRHIPFDVDEADAAEQERAVGFDDDDYR